MTGTIYSGIKNIYDVRSESGEHFECRIKGKQLREDEQSYNPLAPGDVVSFDLADSQRGFITDRHARVNRFARWNRKRGAWQTIAANLDGLLCVISATKPPFRPRFVDRVLIAAKQGGVPSSILVNKVDLGVEPWILERVEVWRSLGIEVLLCSAVSKEGISKVKDMISNRTMVLFGPSGVGKTTIINALIPGLDLVAGTLSAKSDRGRHITNFARLLDAPDSGKLVDTPGIREIHVHGIAPEELSMWFPDFDGEDGDCSFQPCSHRHEPECGVRLAVEAGRIHPDRYRSYLRMRDDLENNTQW